MKIDINPRRWISPYHNTSILHLILMVLFYHAVGVLLLLVGSAAIQFSVNGHVGPSIPRYLAPVLGAGPIEESIFFGIPYYATGNQFVVIISGVTWVMLHIFNTKSMDVMNLSYSNWLFVMPSFFYSLRTWISGKGWFAILAHSIVEWVIFHVRMRVQRIPLCYISIYWNVFSLSVGKHSVVGYYSRIVNVHLL